MATEDQPAHTPGKAKTWHDADEQSVYFAALLEKYHGDYEKALAAQKRGEEVDHLGRGAGSAMP